jgi:hypothetical protein
VASSMGSAGEVTFHSHAEPVMAPPVAAARMCPLGLKAREYT